MTKIVKCNCENSYQDEKYGKRMRVMNETRKGEKNGESVYRCTVCGTEKRF